MRQREPKKKMDLKSIPNREEADETRMSVGEMQDDETDLSSASSAGFYLLFL